MPVDPHTRIETLLDEHEVKIRDAFLAMVATIKSASTLQVLADLIERGDLEGALSAALRGAPAMLGRAHTEAFVAAAEDTARAIGKSLGEIILVFDQTNLGAVEAMRANRLRLITGFNAQQRETVRQVLIDGIQRGLNPRQIAREFRASIGLTSRQVQWLNNYRRALESLDVDALERTLRDRRFDPTVRRAIELNRPLTRTQVNQMVERYRERLLIYRSETIARSEALRAVHQGAEAMYDQAIAAGELAADQLERVWNTAKDERVRPSHKAMHGQKRAYGEPFLSGSGNLLRYPGDPNAPASDTVLCRCALGTRIASLIPTAVGIEKLARQTIQRAIGKDALSVDAAEMTYEDALTQPRIAIAGVPKAGKTSLAMSLNRQNVIHTDDFMHLEWSAASDEIVQQCRQLDNFVVEGVRVPHALRKGLDVDVVIWLETPWLPLNPRQITMGRSIRAVFDDWRLTASIPVIFR